MGKYYYPILSLLLLTTILPSIPSSTAKISSSFSTYIVHVNHPSKPAAFLTHRHWYVSTLHTLPDSHLHPPTLLYTYSLTAAGFAARLTPSQAAALSLHPSILHLEQERIHHPHTTHTPTFLHLSQSSGLWPNSDYADDVIVGVLDTGIWPGHRSFSGSGLGPVPAGWKGKCETGKDFPETACNGKIIGARFFLKGYEATRLGRVNETEESRSPRDTEGHGTHTASTAAGGMVDAAGLFGFAEGEAKGMATKARIAAYKICWALGCFDSDILAAMDAAVADGVHVISLSVGSNGYSPEFYRDSIAIGAFGAVREGVVVSCSAGNSGPGKYTAVNIAPWILTVGASTVDREFPADALLGNGKVYGGVSLYSGEPLKSSNIPLVYAGDCGSRLCIRGYLNESLVAGKIVLCDRGTTARVEKGGSVKLAGGAGMILANTAASGEELVADAHLVPATMVGQLAGVKIRDYIKSDPNPTATIRFRGTVIGPSPAAPKVAAFSSRGPNYRSAEILKPDVIAPGVNILAAWTGASSPTDLDIDPRRVEFNIISGTSMSCPHASGLAALLRKAHLDWSPAAVKSALMTTAYNSDNSGGVIGDLANGGESTPFVRGAGHVDPNKALDPGLVYDITTDDYIAYLCAIGYTPQQMLVIVNDASKVNCSTKKLTNPGDLNYPSFSVVFESLSDSVTYTRSVKTVGDYADVVYEVAVSSPEGVETVVSPTKLYFSDKITTLSYKITFTSKTDRIPVGLHAFGSVAWSDGAHVVRSPVAFTWKSGMVASI